MIHNAGPQLISNALAFEPVFPGGETGAGTEVTVITPQPNEVLHPSAKAQPTLFLITVGPLVPPVEGSAANAQPGIFNAGAGKLRLAKQVPGAKPTVRAGFIVSFVAVVPTNRHVGDLAGGHWAFNMSVHINPNNNRQKLLQVLKGLDKILIFMRFGFAN
jgi:hypothetical protein